MSIKFLDADYSLECKVNEKSWFATCTLAKRGSIGETLNNVSTISGNIGIFGFKLGGVVDVQPLGKGSELEILKESLPVPKEYAKKNPDEPLYDIWINIKKRVYMRQTKI